MRHFSLACLLGTSLLLASCATSPIVGPVNTSSGFRVQTGTPPPGGEPCKVTGGGWINYGDCVDPKVTFGFNAQPNDPFKGDVEVVDHGTGQNFHGGTITSSTCVGNTATVTGILDANSVYPGAAFTLIVTDNGEPGTSDTFFFTVPSQGYTRSGTLAGGNIQLH